MERSRWISGVALGVGQDGRDLLQCDLEEQGVYLGRPGCAWAHLDQYSPLAPAALSRIAACIAAQAQPGLIGQALGQAGREHDLGAGQQANRQSRSIDLALQFSHGGLDVGAHEIGAADALAIHMGRDKNGLHTALRQARGQAQRLIERGWPIVPAWQQVAVDIYGKRWQHRGQVRDRAST